MHMYSKCVCVHVTRDIHAIKCDAGLQIGLKMLERQWLASRRVFSTQWTGQNRKRPLERSKTIKAVNSLGKCQRERYRHCKWEYFVCQVSLILCGQPVTTKRGKPLHWIGREGHISRKKPDNALFFTETSRFENRTWSSFQADAFGFKIILIPQAVLWNNFCMFLPPGICLWFHPK